MNLTIGSCAWDEQRKATFKRSGMALLRKVAKLLDLKKGEYELRYNPAGIACSGDCTLHADNIYISFNLDCCEWVLVRKCKTQKDYTGGPNYAYPFESLKIEGAEGLAEFASAIMNDKQTLSW